jgi:hypothetical protein
MSGPPRRPPPAGEGLHLFSNIVVARTTEQ